MVVYPGTSDLHSETFARALGVSVSKSGGTYPGYDGASPESIHDWVFWVGANPAQKAQIEDLRAKGSKIAAYWIGSDSLMAIQDPEYRGHIPPCDVHFAVHERITGELRQWNVEATTVWPCARNFSQGLPKPQEPKVGVYMPHKGPLYQYDLTLEVARACPELPFVLFGGMEPYSDLPQNVTDAGRLTPQEAGNLQDSFSCLLRLCAHDGNPIGGIEMKQRNRHVISNFPYEGFLYAHTFEDAVKYLSDIKTHEGDFGPYPAYYRERCSDRYFKQHIEEKIYVQQGKIAWNSYAIDGRG